jgi:hypothetical protein
MLFQLDNTEIIWFKFSSLFLFNWLISPKVTLKLRPSSNTVPTSSAASFPIPLP